jgi:hypothetical protein
MQFSRFLIGKMDMWKRALLAPKNPDVVDCSRPAALARVAVSLQFYKASLIKFAVSLLCVASFLACQYPAYGDEQKRELRCADGEVKLTEYVDGEQKLRAHIEEKGPPGRNIYCGFYQGQKVLLKDISGFTGNPERDLQAITVYRGLFDSACSQGKLLIVNNRTNLVVILNAHDFTMYKYQCDKLP